MATRKQQALMKSVRAALKAGGESAARINAGGWQRDNTPVTVNGFRVIKSVDVSAVIVRYDDGTPDILFGVEDRQITKRRLADYERILTSAGFTVEMVSPSFRERPYLKVTQAAEEQPA